MLRRGKNSETVLEGEADFARDCTRGKVEL
jgi:hypothetical protein